MTYFEDHKVLRDYVTQHFWPWTSQSFLDRIGRDHYSQIFEWAVAKNIPHDIIQQDMQMSPKVFDYFNRHGWSLKRALNHSSLAQETQVYQWYRDHSPFHEVTRVAVEQDNRFGLTRLENYGELKLTSDLPTIAADKGYFKMLQKLRELNCPWNWDVLTYALRKGHLEILKWAIQEGCPTPPTWEILKLLKMEF
jgi:hypothetical protein